MDHRASTGSLPPPLDHPGHYSHPPPPQHYHNQYATNHSSASGDSADDADYYGSGPPHGPPPGHGPYPGPPPHMGFHPPPHPLMRGALPGQPVPMHTAPPSLRGAPGEDFRGGGPREPPGPGGIGHRHTVSSGGPKPILRQPAAPPPPGDYPPSPDYRRPPGPRNPDAPQPGASTRDPSPDDFDYDGRQYMNGRQPSRGGFPPDPRYSYDQAEARYHMEQAQQGRGRPGDQSPPYGEYDGSYGRGPDRARSRSRPPARSRSVGPGARSRSRPPDPQSAGPLVRAPQRDWFDEDYDDYDETYLGYPNGSDEVSGGSGPSRGAGNTHSRSVARTSSVSQSAADIGHRSTRGDGVVAGGGPSQAPRGPPANMKANIGREADIPYSGSSGAPHRVPKRDSTPAQQAPPAPPPPPRQVPTPAPQQQYAPTPAPPPQQQAPPPPPVAPVPPPAPAVVQQVVTAAPPPQQTTLNPSAGIVAVIPPAAEADHRVVYDADMDREAMMQTQLIPSMGGLTLADPNPYTNYFGMPVELSDKFLYQGSEGRLRSKEERNLSDEEAGAPKLIKTTIGALRDREAEKDRERDWSRRDRDKSHGRGDPRRRRSVSRPPGERRRAGSAGPVEGQQPTWTRISTEIVSVRAVIKSGYDFKPGPGVVTIFKVLTRDEIDDLVDLSRKIREGRKPSGRGDRDRRDRDDRDRERDRHRDDRRDKDERDRDRDRDPRDRPERRHRDSWHGGKPHGGHPGHIEMPMVPHPGMMSAPAPAPAPAPPPPPPPGSVHGGQPPPPPAPAPPPFHAPPMTGPLMAGGLVANPNEPGTFLQYRRNPPKAQGF